MGKEKATWNKGSNPHGGLFDGGKSRYKPTKSDLEFAETRRKLAAALDEISDKKADKEIWDE